MPHIVRYTVSNTLPKMSKIVGERRKIKLLISNCTYLNH